MKVELERTLNALDTKPRDFRVIVHLTEDESDAIRRYIQQFPARYTPTLVHMNVDERVRRDIEDGAIGRVLCEILEGKLVIAMKVCDPPVGERYITGR